jgi:LmbE family N-acetylglucosaminyl deacetylase
VLDWSKQRVLVVAPHPDDEVIGCGGLLARLAREGGEAYVLYFTISSAFDKPFCEYGDVGDRAAEVALAVRYFNLAGHHVALEDDSYQLKLDCVPQLDLIHVLEDPESPLSLPRLSPTVIMTPCRLSYHQDHRAVASAVLTALRPRSDQRFELPNLVLEYEHVGDLWANHLTPSVNFFVELRQEDLDAKISGLSLYSSQWRESPDTRSESALRSLASLRGSQAGYYLAEAFTCLRWRG